MSQSEKTVGAIGLVRVGTMEVTIMPLSQAEEMALDRELRRAAEAHAGDHYTRCKPLLEAAKEAPADRLELLREVARMGGSKAPLSAGAVHDFRFSKNGLPIELYYRGRKATPGLDRAGLAAVITEASADQIAAGLIDLLETADDTKS